MKHLIIGNGIAGITAAKTIRQHDPDCSITVFTDEIHPFGLYARENLAKKMGTGINSPDDLLIHSADDLKAMGIELIYKEVEKVAPKVKQLVFKQGVRYAYDRLLIATGATPRILDIPGKHLMGVHQLRDFDDTTLIEAWLEDLQIHGVVLIGGGLLGLDLCYMLKRRQVPVTLIVREERVGSPYLSEAASQFLEKRLLHNQITLKKNTIVNAYLSVDNLVLDGVKSSDGNIIPTRMAICAIGVRPTTEFLDESGVLLDEDSGAIVVNNYLQTNIDDVYAAGNCASVDGFIAHNANYSATQGHVAGLNMVGKAKTHRVDVVGDLDTRLYDMPFAYFYKRGVSGDDVWRQEDESGFAEVSLKDGAIVAATLLGNRVRFGTALHNRCLSGEVVGKEGISEIMQAVS